MYSDSDVLYRRAMGYPTDNESVLRAVANGVGSSETSLEERVAYTADGSDLYIAGSPTSYLGLEDRAYVKAEVTKDLDVISNAEFEERVEELYQNHPQFVDGVTIWLADLMDRKYASIDTFDVTDPGFQHDLKALVETIYVSSKHEDERFDIIDIEFILVDALEKIEGVKQEMAREKLTHDEHLNQQIEELAESPLVAA